MITPDLFTKRRARRTDPDTSQASAVRVADFASGFFSVIIAAMYHGAKTQHEIAAASKLHHSQVHKRLTELEAKGVIERTELRRPGPSGRQCIVWRIRWEAIE